MIFRQITGSVTTSGSAPLFNKGYTVSSSAGVTMEFRGLDPYQSYDVAVYFQSTALGTAYVTDASGLVSDSTTLSNGKALPGTEKGEYVRFSTRKPYEISLGVYGLTVDVYGQSSFIYDALVGVQLKPTGTLTNIAPHLPSAATPVNDSPDVALPVTLSASAFSDPDSGDTHANSRWVVDNNSSFSSPEWDSGDSFAAGTSAAVPGGNLAAGTTYYWRVRYKDSAGNWSRYSTASQFTTANSSGLSNNRRLSALTISEGILSPTFNSSTTSYSAGTVPNTTTSVTVTPTKEHANATLQARVNFGTYVTVTSGTPTAALNLNVGNNTIDVRVTAEDGTSQRVYSTTVSRLGSSNAYLSSLVTTAGSLTPSFDRETTAYTASVPNGTTSVTVTPTREQANATIHARVNGGTYLSVTSGSASSALALNVGLNTIDVRVTAQDSTTIRTYSIGVTRMATGSSNADLSSLSLSSGTLSPAFAAATTTYTSTVANAVTSITVTPTVSDANATIQVRVNGGTFTTVASGTASGSLALNVGTNPIDVKVTAQDGTTIKTYTVTVTRAASSVSTLTALTISSGSLSPTFASATTSYTANVTNAVSSITVTPTKTDANATIDVRVNGGTYTTVASGTASGSLALNVGTNPVEVRVTAQDTTTTTYTVTVTRAASSNADLGSLSLSSGTLSPAFAAATTAYTSTVANAVTSVTVTPTVSDANATIQVRVNGGTFTTVSSGTASGSLALNVGTNPIDVKVTAQDGTTIKTYTVTVTRPSTDATLSALTLSTGSLSPAFVPGTTTYTAAVSGATSSITVTPTRNEANATIEARINGGSFSSVASGSPSGSLSLNLGPNTVDVRVTAQDATTVLTYSITVTRGSSNASLSALTLSSGTLSPVFASGTFSYTAGVSFAVNSITVTPTKAEANATIQARINGGSFSSVVSGSPSGSLALNVGANTVEVRVTAQDTVTVQTYTITVTRATASNDANLSSLVIASGTLSPSFSSATTSYSTTVDYLLSSLSVTPTAGNANASLQIRSDGGSYQAVTSGSSASMALSLSVPSTTVIDVLVTAQDGVTTKLYSISVNKVPDSNADLGFLFLSDGTLSPSFSSATTTYTAGVANAVTSVNVNASPVMVTSSIAVSVGGGSYSAFTSGQSVALVTGSNTVSLKVTAQSGLTKTYTLTITRALSSNANLSSLTLSSGTLSPAFASGTLTYVANVAHPVSSVTVTPTTSDSNASVQVRVNGGTFSAVTSGSASGSLTLNVGSNTVEVLVTAQDASTRTYTISITRAPSTDASLSAITLSSGSLSPVFTQATLSYTAAVGNTVTSITVTPTSTEANATIQIRVNGSAFAAVTSGTASAALPLDVGANTVDLQVTAQDGTTLSNYSISITRHPPSMIVSGNGEVIADEDSSPSLTDHTDFGQVPAGGSQLKRDFAISYAGVSVLALTGTPLVEIGGPHAADFTVTADPATSVGAEGTSFQITFDPKLPGLRTANVSIASNDAITSPYTFAIQGYGSLPAQLTQTITFTVPSILYVGQGPLTLDAYASSGLPVSYTLVSGPATLVGNVLTVTGTGTVKIQALQTGGGHYKAATPVTRSITVKAAPTTLTLLDLTQRYTGTPRPIRTTGTMATVTISYKVGGVFVPTAPTAAGSYSVKAEAAGTTKTGTLVITKAPLMVRPDDQRKFAGQPNPVLTFGYEGFVPTETAAVVTRPPVVTTSATVASPGGVYPITSSGGTAANYTMIHQRGSMVVETFAGTYEALLVDTAPLPVGKLSLTVLSSSKKFTGKLYSSTESADMPLFGDLISSFLTETGSGTATAIKNGNVYSVTFTLPLYGPFTAQVTRNSASLASATDGVKISTKAASYAGAHTMLLAPGTPVSALVPEGAGWAKASISSTGVMTLSGRLGDDTTFTATLSPDVEEDPGYRLFAQPYLPARVGSYVAGLIVLESHPVLTGRRYVQSGNVLWAKQGLPTDAAYRSTFGPVNCAMTLDPWIKPSTSVSLHTLLGFSGAGPTHPVQVDHTPTGSATHGNLPLSVYMTNGGTVSVISPPLNPAKWKVTFSPTYGTFTGSFELVDGGVPRAVPFNGALRQPASAAEPLFGRGHFILPPLSGGPITTKTTGEIQFKDP